MHDTTPERPEARCCGTSRCRWTDSSPAPATAWTGCPRRPYRPGLVEEYIQTTGAVLGGRDGWDAFPDPNAVYGGAWSGPIFVLTHHPDDAEPAEGVTFLSCDVAEAVQIARRAAGGKNLEVLSPTIGRQLLERGLLDEIDNWFIPACSRPRTEDTGMPHGSCVY